MKVTFKKWAGCETKWGSYVTASGPIALTLMKRGEIIAKATVNLIDFPVPASCIAIKNYSENEGMVQALIDAGVVMPEPVWDAQAGKAEAPIHKLTSAAWDEIEKSLGRMRPTP